MIKNKLNFDLENIYGLSPDTKDGILAILFCCIYFLYFCFPGIYNLDSYIGEIFAKDYIQRFILNIPENTVIVVSILLIVKLRKQSFKTLGLKKKTS